jgi:hypothetical protein
MATTPAKSPWAAPRPPSAPCAVPTPLPSTHQRLGEQAQTRLLATHSSLQKWIAQDENQLLVCCITFIGVVLFGLWLGARSSK